MRRLGLAVLAVVIGAGTAFALTRVTSQAPSQEKRHATTAPAAAATEPRAAFEDLDCAPGELIGGRMPISLPPTAVGPTTADQALEKDILAELPRLTKSFFRETMKTSDRVQFTYERVGKRLAQALAVKKANGWVVARFLACSSVTEGRG